MKAYPPPPRVIDKIYRFLFLIFYMFLLIPQPSYSTEPEHDWEIRFVVYNHGDSETNDTLIIKSVSPVWTVFDGNLIISKGDSLNYHKLAIPPGDSVVYYFNQAGYAYNFSSTFPNYSWGKYEFNFLYTDDNELTFFHDSLKIDFTDSNYCNYNPYFRVQDIYIRYNWVTKNLYCSPTEPVIYKIFDKSNVKIWDILVDSSSYPDYENSQRNTRFFIPEKAKQFSLSGSSGNPYLTWLSNGETFPVQYKIYRRLNSKYGSYTNVATTTNTNFTDTEISCVGYGSWTAYYYIKVKNNSTGSTQVSASTDTLDILYNCLSKESAGHNEPFLYELLPNFPNPFNPSTEISYRLPVEDYVSLKIYNTLGQEVRTLVNHMQSAGLNKVIWDGKNSRGQSVPSGIYLYRLETKSFTKTMKMLMVK